MIIQLPPDLRKDLLELRIFEFQMNLIMDIIEEWHDLKLDREAVFKEMKDRIAAMRRKELIKPVE